MASVAFCGTAGAHTLIVDEWPYPSSNIGSGTGNSVTLGSTLLDGSTLAGVTTLSFAPGVTTMSYQTDYGVLGGGQEANEYVWGDSAGGGVDASSVPVPPPNTGEQIVIEPGTYTGGTFTNSSGTTTGANAFEIYFDYAAACSTCTATLDVNGTMYQATNPSATGVLTFSDGILVGSATAAGFAPVTAPEIDPASAMGGLTLLAGALAVLRGRRALVRQQSTKRSLQPA
jgi:hypothetical protein